jgi:hypothetical protein
MIKRAAIVVLLLGTAQAQPGAVVPAPPGATEPIVSRPEPALLSEGAALGLSLGGTFVAYTMFGISANLDDESVRTPLLVTSSLATLLAPSAGHWYAGTIVTRGFGLRVGGLAAGYVGLGLLLGCVGHHDDECRSNETLAVGLLILGAGLWATGTIDDIVQAPKRVARINAQRRAYAVVPIASADSVGVAVIGRF